MIKLTLAVVVSFVAITGGAVAGQKAAKRTIPRLEEIRRWKKVNSSPLLLPTALNTLCRPATLIETRENPHRDKYFTVYVNKIGTGTMMSGRSAKFPHGSVIVKEKLPGKDAKKPELLTAMVKREIGYDPSGGDWEYTVLDGTGRNVLESGKLPHCKSCHTGQKPQDYLFRTYLPGRKK